MTPEIALPLMLITPILGGLLIVAAGRHPNLRETITLVTAVSLFLITAFLTPHILHGALPEHVLVEMMPGMALTLKADPLGIVFALVASILWIINSLYSIGYMRKNGEKNQTRFYLCFALALASVMGIALAGNMLTLFIFYEALTLVTYPLVTHAGTKKAKKAGRTYLGILLVSSIGFQMLAMIWTWSISGTLTFSPEGILAGHVEGPMVLILLALYMFGIGKAALMPLHRWLPAAMVAPTPVSALLHAVAVVKAGVFTVVRVVMHVFGLDLLNATSNSNWLLYVACFTIITASVIALHQNNLKRRLAYSTVSQLSYVVLGAAILAPISMVGAVMHIVVHAFGKITLFFAAGAIYTAQHKTLVSELDGIGRIMPWTMGAFTIGAISMVGLPPTAGFLSKWFILQGAMETGQSIAVVVVVISTLLNAAYFLPIVYRAFFLSPTGNSDTTGDTPTQHVISEAPLPMVIALSTTAACTLLLFFYPEVPLTLATMLTGTTNTVSSGVINLAMETF
ncbi:MAG: monovalent cation/H+ antiporter subunit D family protein [Magnetococcales bacterium]|nr:monovalent cation/H+ antiporter subunit D family protein [Magnetococcales bacterium]